MVATFRGDSECGKLICSSIKKLFIRTYDTVGDILCFFYHCNIYSLNTRAYLQTFKDMIHTMAILNPASRVYSDISMHRYVYETVSVEYGIS